MIAAAGPAVRGVTAPARFTLVGTMNLCPCGGRGDAHDLNIDSLDHDGENQRAENEPQSRIDVAGDA